MLYLNSSCNNFTNDPESTTAESSSLVTLIQRPFDSITSNGAEKPPRVEASTMNNILLDKRFAGVREIIGWSLAAVSTVLFIVSLTINIIMLWVYKKRQSKDSNVETPMFEMEANPCYEVTTLQQTADTAVPQGYIYERVMP